MAHEILTLIAEDHDNFIHILADRKRNEAFVVDPAWDAEGIREVLAEENLTLTGILITHSHHDHVNAVRECEQPTIPGNGRSGDGRSFKGVHKNRRCPGD